MKSRAYEDYINKAKIRRAELLNLSKGDSRRGDAACFPTGIVLNDGDFKQILAVSEARDGEEMGNKYPDLHIHCAKRFFFTSLYDIEEITKYLETINSYNKQLEFLVEIKANFGRDLNKMDLRSAEEFGQDYSRDFLKSLTIEIDRLKELVEIKKRDEEIDILQEKRFRQIIEGNRELLPLNAEPSPFLGAKLDLNAPVMNKQNKNSNTNSITARQAVIILLTLMYGSPEVPDGTTKTEVASSIISLIDSLKDLDISNIPKYVGNPIKAKAESVKERQYRINDITEVINLFRKLGIKAGRWKDIKEKLDILEAELQEIKSIKQQDEEEKRNNR